MGIRLSKYPKSPEVNKADIDHIFGFGCNSYLDFGPCMEDLERLNLKLIFISSDPEDPN